MLTKLRYRIRSFIGSNSLLLAPALVLLVVICGSMWLCGASAKSLWIIGGCIAAVTGGLCYAMRNARGCGGW